MSVKKLKGGCMHADTSFDPEPATSNGPLHGRWQDGWMIPDTPARHTEQCLFSLSLSTLENHTQTVQTHSNGHGAVGARLGGLSRNWIGFYLGSVVKVKRQEAFSKWTKDRWRHWSTGKGHYEPVLREGCARLWVREGLGNGRKGRRGRMRSDGQVKRLWWREEEDGRVIIRLSESLTSSTVIGFLVSAGGGLANIFSRKYLFVFWFLDNKGENVFWIMTAFSNNSRSCCSSHTSM